MPGKNTSWKTMPRDRFNRGRPVCGGAPELPLEDIPQEIDKLLGALAERRLGHSALLWLAGHGPLTFFAGQLLYTVAPLAALCGMDRAPVWAAYLSRAGASRDLRRRLHGLHMETGSHAHEVEAHELETHEHKAVQTKAEWRRRI